MEVKRNTYKMDRPTLSAIQDQLFQRTPYLAEKFAPIYQALDWEWTSTDGVPTVDDLRAKLDNMICKLCPFKEEDYVKTGGLYIEYKSSGSMWIVNIRMEIEDNYYFRAGGLEWK